MKLNDKYGICERFRLIRKLKQGGEGGILRVHDRKFKRPAVLKRLTFSNKELSGHVANMSLLYRSLVDINHPNIIRVYEFVQDEDRNAWLLMEYYDSMSLDKAAANNIISPKTLYQLLLQICSALTLLHSENILHLDVTPANMLIKKSGDIFGLKLVDFGFSAFKNFPPVIRGTPGYVAPEISAGETPDESADIYSLGITLKNLVSEIDIADEKARGVVHGLIEKMIMPDKTRRSITLEEIAGRVSGLLKWHILNFQSSGTLSEHELHSRDDYRRLLYALTSSKSDPEYAELSEKQTSELQSKLNAGLLRVEDGIPSIFIIRNSVNASPPELTLHRIFFSRLDASEGFKYFKLRKNVSQNDNELEQQCRRLLDMASEKTVVIELNYEIERDRRLFNMLIGHLTLPQSVKKRLWLILSIPSESKMENIIDSNPLTTMKNNARFHIQTHEMQETGFDPSQSSIDDILNVRSMPGELRNFLNSIAAGRKKNLMLLLYSLFQHHLLIPFKSCCALAPLSLQKAMIERKYTEKKKRPATDANAVEFLEPASAVHSRLPGNSKASPAGVVSFPFYDILLERLRDFTEVEMEILLTLSLFSVKIDISAMNAFLSFSDEFIEKTLSVLSKTPFVSVSGHYIQAWPPELDMLIRQSFDQEHLHKWFNEKLNLWDKWNLHDDFPEDMRFRLLSGAGRIREAVKEGAGLMQRMNRTANPRRIKEVFLRLQHIVQYLESAEEKKKAQAYISLKYGETLKQTGRLEAAKNVFLSLLRSSNIRSLSSWDRFEAYSQAAYILELNGEADKAEKTLLQYKRDPGFKKTAPLFYKEMARRKWNRNPRAKRVKYFALKGLRLLKNQNRSDPCPPETKGMLLELLGNFYLSNSDFHSAEKAYAAALNSHKEHGSFKLQFAPTLNRGSCRLFEGDIEKALPLYRKAYGMAKKVGSFSLQGKALINIGAVMQNRGNFAEALKYYRRALKVIHFSGTSMDLGSCACNTGYCALFLGRTDQALLYSRWGFRSSKRLGNFSVALENLLLQARSLHAQRKNKPAAALLKAVLNKKIPWIPSHCYSLNFLIKASTFQGLMSVQLDSLQEIKDALKLLKNYLGANDFNELDQSPLLMLSILNRLILLKTGNITGSLKEFSRAHSLKTNSRDPYVLFWHDLTAAKILLFAQERLEAAQFLVHALKTARRLHNAHFIKLTKRLEDIIKTSEICGDELKSWLDASSSSRLSSLYESLDRGLIERMEEIAGISPGPDFSPNSANAGNDSEKCRTDKTDK